MVPKEDLRQRKIGVLTGPTASGKTAFALRIASNLSDIEIINADSLLVYRGMDIGTAKPSIEERSKVTHHLMDIRNPDESFTAGDFVRLAMELIDEIHSRQKRALIVGGTGFYLKALLYGLWEGPPGDTTVRSQLEKQTASELHSILRQSDPASAERIGSNDRYRLVRALELIQLSGKTPTLLQRQTPPLPDPRFRLWVLDRDRHELEDRIRARTQGMLKHGLISEVEFLISKYPEARLFSAIGYAQVIRYLQGRRPEGRKVAPGIPGLEEEIVLATRQLVKRQRTWFRKQAAAQWFILDRDLDTLKQQFFEVYGK